MADTICRGRAPMPTTCGCPRPCCNRPRPSPSYQRFTTSFPTIAALAAASEEQVLTHWSGLGYYARGRNLQRAAKIIMEKHCGEFPRRYEQILELPGIGRAAAAAMCALALHGRRAILDGNVKRVLARYCGIEGWAGEKKVEER